MAPRASWNGFLRLSQVQCPVALYPATTETREDQAAPDQQAHRPSHSLRPGGCEDRPGGRRRRSRHGIRGRKGPIRPDLRAGARGDRARKQARHRPSDEFVPATGGSTSSFISDPIMSCRMGPRDRTRSRLLRDTIARMGRVALGRVVLTNREHVIALERRGKGMVGMLLRYPHEIRRSDEIFAGIADVTLPRDTPDLAERIVEARSGHSVRKSRGPLRARVARAGSQEAERPTNRNRTARRADQRRQSDGSLASQRGRGRRRGPRAAGAAPAPDRRGA